MTMILPTDAAQRYNALQSLTVHSGRTSPNELSLHLGYRVAPFRLTSPKLDLAVQLSAALGWSVDTLARLILGGEREESPVRATARCPADTIRPIPRIAATNWHASATLDSELGAVARRYATGAFTEAAALAGQIEHRRDLRGLDRAWAGVWRARALLELRTRADLRAARQALARARTASRRLTPGGRLLINTLRMECLIRAGRYSAKRAVWQLALQLETVRDLATCRRSPEEIEAIAWCSAIGARLAFDHLPEADHRDHFIALFTTKVDEIADALDIPGLRRELLRLDRLMQSSILP